MKQDKPTIRPGKPKDGSDLDEKEQTGAKGIAPGKPKDGSDLDVKEQTGSKGVEDDG